MPDKGFKLIEVVASGIRMWQNAGLTETRDPANVLLRNTIIRSF